MNERLDATAARLEQIIKIVQDYGPRDMISHLAERALADVQWLRTHTPNAQEQVDADHVCPKCRARIPADTNTLQGFTCGKCGLSGTW